VVRKTVVPCSLIRRTSSHTVSRLAIIDDGRIVREGTPARLKAELRERQGLDQDPTLDDVFLDATGRTRSRVAGDVQEVRA
jgi:ABC-2 type transport system ATP-binding protein